MVKYRGKKGVEVDGKKKKRKSIDIKILKEKNLFFLKIVVQNIFIVPL